MQNLGLYYCEVKEMTGAIPSIRAARSLETQVPTESKSVSGSSVIWCHLVALVYFSLHIDGDYSGFCGCLGFPQ